MPRATVGCTPWPRKSALAQHDSVSTHIIYDDPLEFDLLNGQCDSVGTVGKEFLQSRTPYQQASCLLLWAEALHAGCLFGAKGTGRG